MKARTAIASTENLVFQYLTIFSWFPGYAWIITECLGCWSHIGWKFVATNRKLKPEKFYGFSRKNIEAKVEVPDESTDGDNDESENAENSVIVI